jgi:hypothetical protein
MTGIPCTITGQIGVDYVQGPEYQGRGKWEYRRRGKRVGCAGRGRPGSAGDGGDSSDASTGAILELYRCFGLAWVLKLEGMRFVLALESVLAQEGVEF